MSNNQDQGQRNFWDPNFIPDDIFGAPWAQPDLRLPYELPPVGLSDPKANTPTTTTGSSVLGIRFKGGIMIAADTLVSYFSLARYQNVQRVFKINDKTIMSGSGDFADIQSIRRYIEAKEIEDQCLGDNIVMEPKSFATWLTRHLYGRRSIMKPIMVNMVVGGINDDGLPYLSNVNLRGRKHHDYVVGTGFAIQLCLPLVRERKPRTREFTAMEALDLIRKSMEVLYYRDTRNISKFTIGVCTQKYCGVEGPYRVNENWSLAADIHGY